MAKPSFENIAKGLVAHYQPESENSPGSIPTLCPDPTKVLTAHESLVNVLLPGRFWELREFSKNATGFVKETLEGAWLDLVPEVEKALKVKGEAEGAKQKAVQIVTALLESLSSIREVILHDIKAAYDGDPAAISYAEVMISYPGLLAISSHRIAHELYKMSVPIVPRIMSEWAHSETGIDIHPGAQIGKSFFIDHGTGVVIGETTVIGERVKIYQGVTLGAKSFPLDENGNPVKNIRRHPTVENDVVIYAGATILGGDTVIGAGSTIGGGVFLMESVPAGSFVRYARPELTIKQ